jgi:hypothetical protein
MNALRRLERGEDEAGSSLPRRGVELAEHTLGGLQAAHTALTAAVSSSLRGR